MALSVIFVQGTLDGGDPVTSPTWTSTANSLIVAVCSAFNTSGSPAGTDVTDSKGNTYSLAVGNLGGAAAVGTAIYYNNNGTRGGGATHNVTWNAPGTADVATIAIFEVTGQDLTASVFDTTTNATANDATSPYDVTAAAAIVGNQVAFYGVTISTGANTAWTDPTGYTSTVNTREPDGAGLVSLAAYKLNETGTPTVGASSAHAPSAGREVFATFFEDGSVPPTTGPVVAWLRG